MMIVNSSKDFRIAAALIAARSRYLNSLGEWLKCDSTTDPNGAFWAELDELEKGFIACVKESGVAQ